MKKYTATIRRPDGKEYEYTVNAESRLDAYNTICKHGLPEAHEVTEIKENDCGEDPEQGARYTEPWMVLHYNEADAGFGYDPGPRPLVLGPGQLSIGLEKAVAKSIARHMTKEAEKNGFYFEHFWAEEEPLRFV